MKTLGIMSGTSLDGVDFVLSKWKIRPPKNVFSGHFLGMHHVSYPRELRNQLLLCAEGKMDIRRAATLHQALGNFYADECFKAKRKLNWSFDVVGLHGQTVFHKSKQVTLQLGTPQPMAERLRTPVVSDFRTADVTAGGEGAPLATYLHLILLKKALKSGPCTFHNLGGISNVTYISEIKDHDLFSHYSEAQIQKLKKKGEFLSFDTGPANMLLDALMATVDKEYDIDGQTAAKGFIDYTLVKKWVSRDKFIRQKPPKSCGREQYGKKYFDLLAKDLKGISLADKAAHLTEFTALSIAETYRRLPKSPKYSVFAGGGALNKYLMFRIRYLLPEIEIVTADDLGWPALSIEGAAFGALAATRLLNLSGHLPFTTGAKRQLILGGLHLP